MDSTKILLSVSVTEAEAQPGDPEEAILRSVNTILYKICSTLST